MSYVRVAAIVVVAVILALGLAFELIERRSRRCRQLGFLFDWVVVMMTMGVAVSFGVFDRRRKIPPPAAAAAAPAATTWMLLLAADAVDVRTAQVINYSLRFN